MLLTHILWAQEIDTLQEESTSEPKAKLIDTLKNKFVPTGIYVGFDAIAAGKNFYKSNFSGLEYSASVDLYRYLITLDVGNWGKELDGATFNYKNNGHYFRVGADVNFLTTDKERNIFFIGLRYAKTSFSEDLYFTSSDATFGDQQEHFSNGRIQLNWYEISTGLKVKMWKWFWMGYTAGYKFGLKLPKDKPLVPYDVPGYGSTFKTSSWGFAYQLFFHVPVRKFPGPLKVVKK